MSVAGEPYLEIVPIEGNRILVRGASGLLVFAGISPDVFRALAGRALAPGGAAAGSPEAALRQQLEKITREGVHAPPKVRAGVMGNGALADRIADALTSMGHSGVERVAPPPAGEPGAEALRALFRRLDHVVCCIEGAPFATLLAINAVALESPRAVCHFLVLDANDLAVGPSVPDGCLLCNLLRRVPPQAVSDFLQAIPSLMTQTLEAAPQAKLSVSVGLADLVRLAALWGREAEPRLPGTGAGPGRAREEATRVDGCPACRRARESEARWATWRPSSEKRGPLPPWESTVESQRRLAFATAELELRGAARIWHAAHSFRDHLVATHDILAGWRLDEGICLAGLMHSGYSTEQAKIPLFSIAERGLVRRLVGDRAEELAFLFGTIDRALFARDLDAVASGWKELRLRNRFTAEEVAVPAHIAAALAMVEAANLAEQTNDGGFGPGVWVARVTAMLRKAAGALDVPLPFDLGVVIDEETEKKAIAAYQAAMSPGDVATRFERATEAATLNRWVGEPAIVAGFLAAELGRPDEARQWTERGARALRAWGTPWDKRASLHRWLGLGRQPSV